MALTAETLVSGYDFTAGEFGGYASALMQAIQRALPGATYGTILVDTNTPSVGAPYEWRARCLWLDTTVTSLPVLKVYRTTGSPGWFALFDTIAAGSIATAMLQNGAVTLAKLYAPGIGEAAKILRVNAAGNGFELVSLATIITDVGTIPIAALDNTGATYGTEQIIVCSGSQPGLNFWRSADYIASLFGPGAVPTYAIAPASVLTTRSKFISARTGDTNGTYRALDPSIDIADNAMSGSKLVNGSIPTAKMSRGVIGDVLTTVLGTVTWQAPSAPSGTLTKFISTVAVGPGYAPLIPTTVAASVTLAHGLAGIPQSVRVVMYCNTADAGYVSGDEVNVDGLVGFDSTTFIPAFVVRVDVTNVIIRLNAAPFLYIPHKTSGAFTLISPAKWSLKAYCLYLP